MYPFKSLVKALKFATFCTVNSIKNAVVVYMYRGNWTTRFYSQAWNDALWDNKWNDIQMLGPIKQESPVNNMHMIHM